MQFESIGPYSAGNWFAIFLLFLEQINVTDQPSLAFRPLCNRGYPDCIRQKSGYRGHLNSFQYNCYKKVNIIFSSYCGRVRSCFLDELIFFSSSPRRISTCTRRVRSLSVFPPRPCSFSASAYRSVRSVIKDVRVFSKSS